MVDLHSHILPGIDDGAADLDATLRMAQAYVAHGFKAVAATPHIRGDMFGNDETRSRAAFESALEALRANDIPLQLQLSAEYFYDEMFLARLADPTRLLTFGDERRYVLIEFVSANKPMRLRENIFELKVQGITPIMAHPERYHFAEDLDYMELLHDAGMLMQGTLSPLSGMWGSSRRRNLKKLLDHGLIDLISSDLHKPQQATKLLKEAVNKLHEWQGEREAERLLTSNPQAIFDGRPLPA